MNSNENNNKFLVILGPTGIGKTFISLNISKKFNGIIINSDAFSLYKEADVMTAKATEEEKKISPHKLIDVLDLTEVNFNQNNYKNLFENEIKKDEYKNTLFVIVGGTNYYIERILFKGNEQEENNKKIGFEKENEILVDYKNNNKNVNYKEIFDFIIELKNKYKNYDENDILYNNINSYLNNFCNKNNNDDFLFKLLSIIDVEYFNFLHKNDTRRIINVLSFYFTYNYKKSLNSNNLNKSLNFSDCKFIVLLPKNINELKTQIINRIKTMIDSNGINEIFYIFKKFQKNGIEIDFNKGVLQAIGYKEFYKLYVNFNNENAIEENFNNYNNGNKENNSQNIINIINSDDNLKKIFNECCDELIKNTFNYAKYQIKFIKNRIIPFIKQNKMLIVNIEKYNKEYYKENIFNKIFEFIENKNSIDDENNHNIEYANKIKNWKKYFCEKCNKEMNGEYEYNNHMKSNKHKKFRIKKNNINIIKNK